MSQNGLCYMATRLAAHRITKEAEANVLVKTPTISNVIVYEKY